MSTMFIFPILGDIILPLLNILLHTYHELCVVKYIGMKYQTLNACPNDYIIYYGWHKK